MSLCVTPAFLASIDAMNKNVLTLYIRFKNLTKKKPNFKLTTRQASVFKKKRIIKIPQSNPSQKIYANKHKRKTVELRISSFFKLVKNVCKKLRFYSLLMLFLMGLRRNISSVFVTGFFISLMLDYYW